MAATASLLVFATRNFTLCIAITFPAPLLSVIVIRDRNPLTTGAYAAIVTFAEVPREARVLDFCSALNERRGMHFRDPAK